MTDQNLERWLEYPELADNDAFVVDVMAGVRKARRLRRLILLLFGLGGALFGVLGAVLLSDPIARLFTGLPAMGVMQAALFVTAAVSFYLWFMNDDLTLTG
ncbi:MAG: hypothetical protein HKP16_04810 [Xanthomonadales bacterium]|nr:hypothetical protein [Gammaproteobacteria bacterium]NNJ64863.1 hypothetical protein [Xanthomonadales bacterium]